MTNLTCSQNESRVDPLTGDLVLFAPGRDKRPMNQVPALCPACAPGLTPPAVYVWPSGADPEGDDWEIKVVPNKYSAFSDAPGHLPFQLSPFLQGVQDPAGRCEVVFETRRHVYPVYVREPEEIEHCFSALISRYKSARSDPRARLWLAFKNLGRAAGGSLDHDHFQTYCLPFIPPSIERRYARAAEYFKQTGASLYRCVFENEANRGDRVVSKTSHFVTYVPFAASMPYELCIAPLRNSADFSTTSGDELLDFATSFRDAVSRLNSVKPDLAYNVIINTAAFEHASAPWYCWHCSILPRVTTLAGVELATEIMINSVNPETAASTLRGVAVQ